MTLTVGSLFSGIGGFDLGFERAGMSVSWQVEIDKAAQSVLRRRFPNTEIHDDVRTVGKHNLAPVDLICGGFPCQDLSVAGKRAGLAGERSGLWYEYHRILAELEPRWVVIENVPGLLSSDGGRDFAAVLSGLAELRYLSAWRVLDAQYFGVAQRRRRVFIVASLGDGRAAEVLFERESGAWDSAPVRTEGKAAPTLFASGAGTDRTASAGSESEFCIPVAAPLAAGRHGQRQDLDNDTYLPVTAGAVSCKRAKGTGGPSGDEAQNLIAIRTANTGTNGHGIANGVSHTLDGANGQAIAWHENKSGNFTPSDIAKALRSGASHSYQGVGVRRLMPVECERLQGFPDGWTDGQSDSQRYRQCGNAVCVNVAEWIGNRIMAVSE